MNPKKKYQKNLWGHTENADSNKSEISEKMHQKIFKFFIYFRIYDSAHTRTHTWKKSENVRDP